MKDLVGVELAVGKIQNNETILEPKPKSTIATNVVVNKLLKVMVHAMGLDNEEEYDLYIRIPKGITINSLNLPEVDSILLVPSGTAIEEEDIFNLGTIPEPGK